MLTFLKKALSSNRTIQMDGKQMINGWKNEVPMIEVNIDAALNQPAPVRERSVFAIGWVRYKTTAPAKAPAGGAVEDEMSVLGLMIVRDGPADSSRSTPSE